MGLTVRGVRGLRVFVVMEGLQAQRRRGLTSHTLSLEFRALLSSLPLLAPFNTWVTAKDIFGAREMLEKGLAMPFSDPRTM